MNKDVYGLQINFVLWDIILIIAKT